MGPGRQRIQTPGKATRRDSGSALVEFAFLLPILTLLLVGVMDLARIYYYGIVVNNAARAGTQYGIQLGTYSDTTGMTTAAVNEGSASISGFSSSNLVNSTPKYFCRCPAAGANTCSVGGPAPTGGACPGSCTGYGESCIYVEVDTSYTLNLLFSELGPSVTLTGKSIMRAE